MYLGPNKSKRSLECKENHVSILLERTPPYLRTLLGRNSVVFTTMPSLKGNQSGTKMAGKTDRCFLLNSLCLWYQCIVIVLFHTFEEFF